MKTKTLKLIIAVLIFTLSAGCAKRLSDNYANYNGSGYNGSGYNGYGSGGFNEFGSQPVQLKDQTNGGFAQFTVYPSGAYGDQFTLVKDSVTPGREYATVRVFLWNTQTRHAHIFTAGNQEVVSLAQINQVDLGTIDPNLYDVIAVEVVDPAFPTQAGNSTIWAGGCLHHAFNCRISQ